MKKYNLHELIVAEEEEDDEEVCSGWRSMRNGALKLYRCCCRWLGPEEEVSLYGVCLMCYLWSGISSK